MKMDQTRIHYYTHDSKISSAHWEATCVIRSKRPKTQKWADKVWHSHMVFCASTILKRDNGSIASISRCYWIDWVWESRKNCLTGKKVLFHQHHVLQVDENEGEVKRITLECLQFRIYVTSRRLRFIIFTINFPKQAILFSGSFLLIKTKIWSYLGKLFIWHKLRKIEHSKNILFQFIAYAYLTIVDGAIKGKMRHVYTTLCVGAPTFLHFTSTCTVNYGYRLDNWKEP